MLKNHKIVVIDIKPHIASEKLGEKVVQRGSTYLTDIERFRVEFLSDPEMGKYVSRGY